MTKKETPKEKFLKDYKSPDFTIKSIYLDFKLDKGITTVKATSEVERLNKECNILKLDGEKLDLKSVKINGEDVAYKADDKSLSVASSLDKFTLETIVEIKPEQNTELEGLYKSSGNYCTQCEPEGFRKITYFIDRPDVMAKYKVRIEANKKHYPVLLSNGNCIEQKDIDAENHYAIYEDPFPKPSYLFALVAGDLSFIKDSYKTQSGKDVALFIYCNHGDEDKCYHAMASLKKSMEWDEKVFGREYDLDIFNIVAVHDFNMGAMENKSLNIFNSKLVLAKPETATDADFLNIERVIAHEYFHNWTGNRITCRDWFQLSLKEGFTVFRENTFAEDMNSEEVNRIEDIENIRNVQFPEDAGPTAHPIRPESYISMNNFYTATVYEKGGEVIRMYRTLMGKETFRKATDLYFDRHDGQAVTCNDFIRCMEDASKINLSQFSLWYSQAGTPDVFVTSNYDESKKEFTLNFEQKIPDTPNQKNKKPMHIPIATGLLSKNGEDMLEEKTKILELREAKQSFTFDNIEEKPIPSILRGFSAPVKLFSDLTDSDLLFLMSNDSDGFNRWDAAQTYLTKLILSKPTALKTEVLDAFYKLIIDRETDSALLAKTLTLPSIQYLNQFTDVIDVEGVYDSHHFIMKCIANKHLSELQELYRDNIERKSYEVTPKAVGKRMLKNIALNYIKYGDKSLAENIAFEQYEKANNMTDKIAALSVLSSRDSDFKNTAFETFYNLWKNDILVMDKWFSLQAVADREDVVELVEKLTQHPDFTYKNPNRIRALLGAFSANNHRWFHRKDGAGYKLLANNIIKIDSTNPQIAARISTPFKQWKKYDNVRKDLMKDELNRILSHEGLSSNVYEIISKTLG